MRLGFTLKFEVHETGIKGVDVRAGISLHEDVPCILGRQLLAVQLAAAVSNAVGHQALT